MYLRRYNNAKEQSTTNIGGNDMKDKTQTENEMIQIITSEIGRFFKTQQKERIDKLKILNQDVQKGGILFTGSSLMEQFPINELMMTENDPRIIYNRGVGGFTTADMLQNMDTMVFDTEPSKIFINIGTNDIASADFSKEALLNNYEEILSQIHKRLPDAAVYVDRKSVV